MYRETSRDAYHSLENIGNKQRAVLTVIMLYQPCNDRMIKEHLGWEINQVTGRRNELVELDMVEESGRKIDPKTKRPTIYWKVKQKQLVMNF